MMNYSKLVPSRELCEEMARLGICQDVKDLVWLNSGLDCWYVDTFPNSWNGSRKEVVAPTLPRMMEELPHEKENIAIRKTLSNEWCVAINESRMYYCYYTDNSLPNAVAKALIAIEKGE